jgi:hypothetical protein
MSITVRVSTAQASSLGVIKAILLAHPGEHEVTIVAGRRNRERRLTLGPDFNCDDSRDLCARLSEFGDIVVNDA